MASDECDHRVTADVLAEALANELNLPQGDVEIKSFEVADGSGKGDNFACVVKAVDFVAVVNGKELKHHYLVKSIPMNEYRAKWLKETGMFSAEVAVYERLLPRIRDLEKNCECIEIVTPKHFYASVDEGVIVMADMRREGYYMQDKLKGLTLHQVRLVLNQLAQLHATSYHFLTTFPGGAEAFKKEFEILARETWFRRCSDQLDEQTERMFAAIFESVTLVVEEFCHDNNPGLINKLREFNKVRKRRIDDIQRPAEDAKGFNCMLHNDAWCNNFLFRNDADGMASEAVLLDFQLVKRGRPGVDLAYFLGSSTTPEFRKTHLEELLKLYHKELSRVLLVHGYDAEDVYPFATFRKEFDECYVFGFVLGAVHEQMALEPPVLETKTDEDHLRKVEEYKQALIGKAKKNPVRRNRLIAIVREAEALGILCAA